MKSILSLFAVLLFGNLFSQTNITQAEYFFDTDPGFGSATSITVTATNSFVLNNFNVVTQNLTEGIHFLYVRCKNANNKWSVPVRRVLYVSPNLNAPSSIIAAEYFIDTDPGYDLGNTINITAGTIVQPNFNVITNGLSVGNHFLYVRVKNQNNIWSAASKRAFTVDDQLSVVENLTGDFKMYPNPTTGKVNISIGNETIDKVELLDILGKKVMTKSGDCSQIDLSTFSSGVYIFKIFSGNKVMQKYIIKQ